MAAIGEAVVRFDGPVAVFMHKPLFLKQPYEPPSDYFTIPPDFRAALVPVVEAPKVRRVTTGHLHQCRIHRRDGRTRAWAPSSAFFAGPMRRCGWASSHWRNESTRALKCSSGSRAKPRGSRSG